MQKRWRGCLKQNATFCFGSRIASFRQQAPDLTRNPLNEQDNTHQNRLVEHVDDKRVPADHGDVAVFKAELEKADSFVIVHFEREYTQHENGKVGYQRVVIS